MIFSLFTSIYANECKDLVKLSNLEYLQLGDLNQLQSVVTREVEGPLFSKSLMQDSRVVDKIGDFNPYACEDALSSKIVLLSAHAYLNFIFTNEDYCDGGNSYGYILNQDDILVGYIADSFIQCF
jgi:hypothetical protein